MSMPVLSGSAVWMTPATSPSLIRLTAAPALRTAPIKSAWRGVFWIARADRDFVHIDVGSVQQRAVLSHSEGGEGTRHVLGAERRPLERIDRDVHLGSGSGADLLTNE